MDEITAALMGITVKDGKCQEVDGVFYRRRRGKVVAIPPEWVGNITTQQTIRKRGKNLPAKLRKALKYGMKPGKYQKAKYQHIDD